MKVSTNINIEPLYLKDAESTINEETGRGILDCGLCLVRTDVCLAVSLIDHQNNFHTAHIPIADWNAIIDKEIEARRLAQLAAAVADVDGDAPRHFETVEWSEGAQVP